MISNYPQDVDSGDLSNPYYKDVDLMRCNDIHLHMDRVNNLKGKVVRVDEEPLKPNGHIIYQNQHYGAMAMYRKTIPARTKVVVVKVHQSIIYVDYIHRTND